MTILAWIAGTPSSWNVFVSHRVSKIQQVSERYNIEWKYVNSQENPADILSRGALPKQLFKNRFWFNGPKFLKGATNEWPHVQHIKQTNEEKRKTALPTNCNSHDLISSSKFSNSYKTLIKVFAYVSRFIQACKGKANLSTVRLELTELQNAEKLVIKIIQHKHYNEELKKLKAGLNLNSQSKLLPLNPFIDEEGLIRVGGRLVNAEIVFDAKHPIVLPRQHIFSASLIKYLHIKHMHVGCLTLHAILRQRYWIPSARQLIRSIIYKCVKCFRITSRSLEQLMGQLPSERVRPSFAFLHTGVDYCGPFTIKPFGRSKSTFKSYIALFVCLTKKAVHLEIVSNLSY